MLLHYFILSAWFVACFCGGSFNYIVPPSYAIQAKHSATNILLPHHHKPPDPQRIVKVIIATPTDATSTSSSPNTNITYSVNNRITYEVTKRSINRTGSLIDRGANGSIAGSDVCIIETNDPPHTVNVCGIDNHELNNIPIVTCAGVVTSHKGPLTLIMNQYASIGKGHSIHASPQLEHHDNIIDDKAQAWVTMNGCSQ